MTKTEKINTALVLGGGGSYAIGWELGYLLGLSEKGIIFNNLDLVIGTSGGAQVATAITSDQTWQEIFSQQINLNTKEIPPIADMTPMIGKYIEIAKNSTTPQQWIENYSTFALENNKFDDSEHINRLKNKIKVKNWPKNLMITAINAQKSERIIFDSNSNVDIYEAMATSGSLPGVWPATAINGEKFYDGGCHSMDNADLAKGAKKVLVLSPNLPISTPHTLSNAITELKTSGSSIEVVVPDAKVIEKLDELGGNTVDPSIRPEIAKLAKEQGIRDAKHIQAFFNDL